MRLLPIYIYFGFFDLFARLFWAAQGPFDHLLFKQMLNVEPYLPTEFWQRRSFSSRRSNCDTLELDLEVLSDHTILIGMFKISVPYPNIDHLIEGCTLVAFVVVRLVDLPANGYWIGSFPLPLPLCIERVSVLWMEEVKREVLRMRKRVRAKGKMKNGESIKGNDDINIACFIHLWIWRERRSLSIGMNHFTMAPSLKFYWKMCFLFSKILR